MTADQLFELFRAYREAHWRDAFAARAALDEALRNSVPQIIAALNAEAERDALSARLAQMEQGQTWQPIATVPKDGRMVLVYPSSCWAADTEFDYEVAYWYVDADILQLSQLADDFDGPTHWMPLPAPPRPPDATQEEPR